ncbi:MAG: PolC-type DNA polymerase III [Bacilli bacterium]|nr:PolC-type DNA polymerase III [Bacilli bacterium]
MDYAKLTVRFLESIGLSDVDRFGLEFIKVDNSDKNAPIHLIFKKDDEWRYDLLMEFLEGLATIGYDYFMEFKYSSDIDPETLFGLYSSLCLDKFRIVEEEKTKFKNGRYLVLENSENKNAVNDFNSLCKFLGFGVSLERVPSSEFEDKEPVKEEVKPVVKEEAPATIQEAAQEEPIEEEVEPMNDEELDAIGQDLEIHKQELNDAFVDFVENAKAAEAAASAHDFDRAKYKKGNYAKVESIIEIFDNDGGNFEFSGTVFAYETRSLKNGKLMATFGVGDNTSAIAVRAVEGGEELSADVLTSFKNGAQILIKGALSFDQRPGQLEKNAQIYVHYLEVLPPKALRDDPCEQKRVELHVHTKMSAMDGLGEMSDYVKVAHNMGMKAIAVTDHGVIQSFPAAEGACADINKKIEEQDKKFKILYGVEFYAIKQPKYGWNYCDTILSKGRYCVFDFETTGLSSKYDKVTEFGAVLIENGLVVERKDFFVNAGVHIPEIIQKKTKITDAMIANGLSEVEAAHEIEKFMEGCILVSHNAQFDVGFLNQLRKTAGLPADTHPVIDTLALSHYLFPGAARHNLGALSRNLKLEVYNQEEAHRADFDAEALNSVWQTIIPLLEKDGCIRHSDLASLVCKDKKMYKHLKSEHVVAIAKNEAGIKAIYRLVSHSETTYMTLGSVPKIPYEELEKERENLIIGSGCSNGGVFQNAMLKSEEELEESMKFFDYIEVQPRPNYSYLVKSNQLSEERLVDVLQTIVRIADKLGKMVCATGDCHYVNPEDKITRDVYICSPAVGGGRHPLWLRELASETTKYESPDQHLRSTREMLDDFEAWLPKEKAFEVVVTNTNKVADMVEPVAILKTRLYRPDANLPGSKEKIEEICWGNIKKIYDIDRDGEYPEDSPKGIIKARLMQELDGIIGNGYSVTYYIAHLLVKKAADDGFFVGSRGSVGSSFAAHMAEITEVNPLPPHYLCPKCKHIEWADSKVYKSGYDLPDKVCPDCGAPMTQAGQSIPFQTFLGFKAEKVPDIDLNFDQEYQPQAHAYTRELLSTAEENELYRQGKTVDSPHVIRAGTISCSEEKNAIGYVKGYYERVLRRPVTANDNMFIKYIASRCCGVKKTTGQHPGGIVVIPADMDIFDFSPYQYPADDESVGWLTTHYEFAKMHDCVLKLDELGHLDPLALRKMKDLTGIDFKTLPMNDKKVLSLFTESTALGMKPLGNKETKEFIKDAFKTGAIAIPEFGTNFVQGLIIQAKPKTFNDLLIISGLSHGTNVWNGNAQDLIVNNGLTLNDVIGCRDDIMNYLIGMGVDKSLSFKMMEDVRKGKFPKTQDNYLPALKEANVPEWYIESCRRIQYLFPRAHATAYVMGAIRVAWYKVYKPEAFYAVYFSTRCDSFDIKAMTSPIDEMVASLKEYQKKRDQKLTNASDEEKIKALLVACELTCRGLKVGKVDLMQSDSSVWTVSKDKKTIIPPFTVIPNFGVKAAESILEARKDGEFISIEDLKERARLGTSTINALRDVGSLEDMPESNQLTLF